MALKEGYVGSVGPFLYYDTDSYADSETFRAFRGPQIFLEDAASEDNEATRYVEHAQAVSTADSKVASNSESVSEVGSAADSNSINISSTGSGVTSNSGEISEVGSTAGSNSQNISVADSKAVSNSQIISVGDSTCGSSVTSNSSDISVVESGVTSNSGNISVAGSGVTSNSVEISEADSASGSNSLNISEADSNITSMLTGKLTLRPTLDLASVGKNEKPTIVTMGVFRGFSLPIWATPANADEELHYEVRVPYRWDGVSDLVFPLRTALGGVETVGNKFQLQLDWESDDTIGVVPATSHAVTVETTVLSGSAAQYQNYGVEFTIDYDLAAGIKAGDVLAGRIRRVSASQSEASNEVIVRYRMEVEFSVDKVYGTW